MCILISQLHLSSHLPVVIGLYDQHATLDILLSYSCIFSYDHLLLIGLLHMSICRFFVYILFLSYTFRRALKTRAFFPFCLSIL